MSRRRSTACSRSRRRRRAGAADTSQRLSVVADARSNSLVARSDNPSRITRLRTLVAMLDTPTSAAGNLHVVYLKNAEAVKVAETLRAIYLGESSACRGRPGPTTASVGNRSGGHAGAAGCRPCRAPQAVALVARHDPGRSGDQLDPHQRARCDLQQPARGAGQARRAPGAGLRRGADRGDHRRQGRRVRHPVAEPERRGKERHERLRRHQLRRTRPEHPRHRGQPGHRRPRPQRRRDQRHGERFPASARSSTSTCWSGRSRPTPTPTSCPRRRC